VNLSRRLMVNAPRYGILVDEETKNRCTTEVIFNALAPIRLKDKQRPVPIFQPMKKDAAMHIGLTPKRRIRFPWYDHPFGGASTSRSSHGPSPQQLNVIHLCSVKTWNGISKVQGLLGGTFQAKMHQGEQALSLTAQTVKAPSGSPFASGGVVVLEGPSGMGRQELAEHIVVHSAMRFIMLPVFGTMGPRPGDSVRLAVELVRSTLGVFRCLKGDQPTNAAAPFVEEDDYQALMKVVPDGYQGSLQVLKEPLLDQAVSSKSSEVLKAALGIVGVLLKSLVKQVAVVLVLSFEFGTSLFPKALEDGAIFWSAVATLYESLKDSMSSHKPLVMMLLCRSADEANAAVKAAQASSSFVQLSGLSEENILSYMSNYLKVQENMVPQLLRQFVANITLGNPHYIRDTIDQLMEHHIQVNLGANKQVRSLECKDLDKINIINTWQHTAMVGNTFCKLESLDPLEAAVLKMSTCFVGSFTLADLAASICSRWSNATHFDFLRLFQALRNLVADNHIDVVEGPPAPADNGHRGSQCRAFGNIQYYQMNNLLIRAVGSSMVLEAQKKSVKRQALIDRALARELPRRMEVVASKRNVQHIPWYYEQAFRRMP